MLFASLREAILSRALKTRVDSFDRALTYAATADYLRNRELAFRKLARGGTRVTLESIHPDFAPIVVDSHDDDELQIIAELVRVLVTGA